MTRRGRRRRRGFTLIEIMIALVVTAVGLTGIAAMFSANAHGTRYARHATEATVLGEDQLESLLGTPTAQLADGDDRVDARGAAVTEGGFSRAWTVTWDGDLARIDVSVTWREAEHDRTIRFLTMRSR